MTTMNNEDPADPSVHEPRVTDAPAEIWLVYGELEHDDTHANLYRDGDVTWCQHQIWASDVRYVRAEAIAAERDRWLRKLPVACDAERARLVRLCSEWARICESGKRHGAAIGARECANLIREGEQPK